MPQISLTDFVDIVGKAGRPKATKVRQVKERPEYEPAFDFYKPLREHLVSVHRTGKAKADVANVLKTQSDPKKLKNYPELIAGYKKWWGNKQLVWFQPPKAQYSHGGFDIMLNPELGLEFNGCRHVIKLFFKNEALTGAKLELIIDLLEHQLRSSVGANDRFAVLDVRKSKLFADGPHHTQAIPMVNAEIAYIAALWN